LRPINASLRRHIRCAKDEPSKGDYQKLMLMSNHLRPEKNSPQTLQ